MSLKIIIHVIRVRFCPVGWSWRPPPANEYPGYDTKLSNREISWMLGLWGMQSTLSFPLLPDPLWPGVVAPDRALSMG